MTDMDFDVFQKIQCIGETNAATEQLFADLKVIRLKVTALYCLKSV